MSNATRILAATIASVLSLSATEAAPVINSVLVTSNAAGTPTSIGINGTGLCANSAVTSCTASNLPTLTLGGAALTVTAATPASVTANLGVLAAGTYTLNLTAGSAGAATYYVTVDPDVLGATGPTGPAGAKGATGPTGAAGAKGTTGATGAAGAKGATGATGTNGSATVAIGLTTTGTAGTAASVTNSGSGTAAVLNFTVPSGANGTQGPQGIQGPVGPAGSTGPIGPTGPTGVGMIWFGAWNSAVPYPIRAVVSYNGSSYIAVQANQSVVPTTDIATNNGLNWNLVAQGGSTGATGAAGAIGATGPQGIAGNVGPQGPAGVTGLQGQPGVTGMQGPTGPQGAPGPAGPTGSAAPSSSSFTLSGSWDASASYSPGNVVTSSTTGSTCLYVALKTVNSQSPDFGLSPPNSKGSWVALTSGCATNGSQSVISTVAGQMPRTPVDARSHNFPYPWPLVRSSSGKIFFESDSAIYRYDPNTQTVSPYAGTGMAGNSGDGGPAIAAKIGRVSNLAIDTQDNLYITDFSSRNVRRVDLAGIITTVFSSPTAFPYTSTVTSDGTLFVADLGNCQIFRIKDNSVTTLPGGPVGVACVTGLTHDASDNVYAVYEYYPGNDDTIVEYGTDGSISVIAPNGLGSFGTAVGLAIDNVGNFYTADFGNRNAILKVARDGTTSIIAGGAAGFTPDGSLAQGNPLSSPWDLAIDGTTLYFTEGASQLIRAIAPDGTLHTLVGNGVPENNSASTFGIAATIGNIATDPSGNIFFGELNRLRRIDPAGALTTVAGTGQWGPYSGDGNLAINTALQAVHGVTTDVGGNVYFTIADQTNKWKVLKYDGNTRTLSTVIQFAANERPNSLSIDANQHLVVTGSCVSPKGNFGEGCSGGGFFAQKMSVYDLNGNLLKSLDSGTFTLAGDSTTDSVGNVYIADAGSHRIKKIDVAGNLTTVAGNGIQGYAGDNGPATAASLNCPASVTVDANGTLFIADMNNNVVRRVTRDGVISTLAGNGTDVSGGDGGPPLSASFTGPNHVAIDNFGNLYVSELYGYRIRKISNVH